MVSSDLANRYLDPLILLAMLLVRLVCRLLDTISLVSTSNILRDYSNAPRFRS